MKKNLAISISDCLWGIGIHLTPKRGGVTATPYSHCKHFNQEFYQINSLLTVAILHQGIKYEN